MEEFHPDTAQYHEPAECAVLDPTYLEEIYEFRERFFSIGCEPVLDLYDMSLSL
jgi:hypothetical protein